MRSKTIFETEAERLFSFVCLNMFFDFVPVSVLVCAFLLLFFFFSACLCPYVSESTTGKVASSGLLVATIVLPSRLADQLGAA